MSAVRRWVWDYNLKHLGSWPGNEYKGHNKPVEVVEAAAYEAVCEQLRLANIDQANTEAKLNDAKRDLATVQGERERDEQGQLKARLNRDLNLLYNSHAKLLDERKVDASYIKQLEAERDAALERVRELEKPILKTYQSCGCVVCTCEGDRCQGCGAKLCNQGHGWPHDKAEYESGHPLVDRLATLEAAVKALPKVEEVYTHMDGTVVYTKGEKALIVFLGHNCAKALAALLALRAGMK